MIGYKIIISKIKYLVFLVFFGSFFITSCTPDRELEIKNSYVDSLKKIEFNNEILLNIDVDKLQERIKLMDNWYIKAADTSFDIAQKMISEITGIKTIYKKYINSYFPYDAELTLIKNETKDFYTNYKNMPKEEFKSKYQHFKTQLSNLEKQLEPISQPVYETEYTYKRLEKEFIH